MKIKKLFSMFVAAFFVLAIAGVAGAADPCSSCKDCVPGNIECSDEQDECQSFDYERSKSHEGSGYCDNHAGNCRVIFDICECVETTENFASGQVIGIRQTILVNGQEGQNGVYWTNSSSGMIGTVALDMYANKDSACDDTLQTLVFEPVSYYLDSEGNDLGVANLVGDNDCSVPVDHKVVMLSSGNDIGYEIKSADEIAMLHEWWIDIPAMVYDNSEITPGDVVSVKIELLNKASAGICASCISICECTVVVGTMCCYDEGVSHCIYFPYVLQQQEGWHSGIAITNLDFSGAAWTPTITFIDAAGAEFVATPTYNKGTVAFLMDDLLNDEGLAPAAGAGWLKVSVTDAAIDGYQYNMLISGNDMFGAAVLPRSYCP